MVRLRKMVTMKLCCVFVCLVMYAVHLKADEEISVDYYFGTAALRSESDESSCENTRDEYLCISECPQNHVCFMHNCICVDIDKGVSRVKNSILVFKRTQQDDVNPPGFVDLTKSESALPYDPYDKYPSKPILRHHIAHFCPNLDIARECIRKCMPLGKPAFCGKDHVCYCGHKYENSPAKDKIDVKSVYANFKDLYKKYFGEQYVKEHEQQDYKDTEENE